MHHPLLRLALLPLTLATTGASPAGTVAPFVGCATDGQQGPQPAPGKPDRMPRLPPRLASQLAYYSTGEIGVLAPRGWRCIGLEGSSGSFLLVTPRAHAGSEFFKGPVTVRGPAVQLTYSFGGTSGRFTVARIAPRYFAEGARFAGDLATREREMGGAPPPPVRRFATDRVLRRGPHTIVVVTPAGRSGLGSESSLAPNKHPITSAAVLIPDPDMDLVVLNVRVGQDAGLTDAIVRDVEVHYAPPSR